LITKFGFACIEGINGSLGEGSQALAAEADFAGMTALYVCGATLTCVAMSRFPVRATSYAVRRFSALRSLAQFDTRVIRRIGAAGREGVDRPL